MKPNSPMPKTMLFSLLPLLLVLMSLAGCGTASSQNGKEKAAKQNWMALNSQLPTIVNKHFREYIKMQTLFPAFDGSCHLRLARMTGPLNAKVIVSFTHKYRYQGGIGTANRIFTIYMQFYDASWTCSKFDANWSKEDEDLMRFVQNVMSSIDQAGSK